MMNYEIFKEVVLQELPAYLKGPCAGREVVSFPTQKVNETLDTLTIKSRDGVNEAVPSLYMNNLYEAYKENPDLQELMRNIAEVMDTAMSKGAECAKALDMDNARERIVFQLINTEQNKEMLSGMPHREWQDLSIVYRLFVREDQEGIYSAMITNSMAEQMGFTEEEMFRLAAVNTKRIFSPTVCSLESVMAESLRRKGMPEAVVGLFLDMFPKEDIAFVISNEKRINGAISMLYEDNLHALAEQLGSDLYILPSSLHETIAVAAKGDARELAAEVEKINMERVELADRLSNQVYFYDKDLRVLSLATDTPSKRLDGMKVAEPVLIYEPKEQSR